MLQHKLRIAPSDHGNSAYEGIMFCPRNARLNKEQREKQSDIMLAGYFGIGTMYHAFIGELYFGKKIFNPEDVHDVEFVSDPANGKDIIIDPEALFEARRLAGSYMEEFQPTHYGKVLHREWNIMETANDAQRVAVYSAVGISPWTGIVDLAVEVGKTHAVFLRDTFGLDIEAGKYLVDLKTAGAEYGNLGDDFRNLHQFKGYLLAANAYEEAAGRKPFKGLIADVCIKTKVPKFRRFLCEAPTELDKAVLDARWKWLQVITEHLPDACNASSKTCFPLWGTCNHFIEGRCSRY